MMKRSLFALGLLGVFALGWVGCAQQGSAPQTSAATGPSGVGTGAETGASGVGGAQVGGFGR